LQFVIDDGGPFLAPVERAWLAKSLIEGLARGCMPAFKRWQLPPLYESGVRYQLPAGHGSGIEHMKLPIQVYRDGWGDCDRLLVWWLCEQWLAGLPAQCSTFFLGGRMHVLGRRSWDESGPLEDPSVVLGAPVPAGWPPKVPLIRSSQLL
jgi:hypothetical protein